MQFQTVVEKAATEYKEFNAPVGSWEIELQRGKFTDPKADKNGDVYVRALIACSLVSPGDDVDPTEAKAVEGFIADGSARLFWNSNLIYLNNDNEMDEDAIAKLINLLAKLGASVAGRKPSEVLKDEIKGLRATGEVKLNDFTERKEVTKIYPVVE